MNMILGTTTAIAQTIGNGRERAKGDESLPNPKHFPALIPILRFACVNSGRAFSALFAVIRALAACDSDCVEDLLCFLRVLQGAQAVTF